MKGAWRGSPGLRGGGLQDRLCDWLAAAQDLLKVGCKPGCPLAAAVQLRTIEAFEGRGSLARSVGAQLGEGGIEGMEVVGLEISLHAGRDALCVGLPVAPQLPGDGVAKPC